MAAEKSGRGGKPCTKLAQSRSTFYNQGKVCTPLKLVSPFAQAMSANPERVMKEAHEVEFGWPVVDGLVRVVGIGSWHDCLWWWHHWLHVGIGAAI
jgi:hypothetical protein